MQDITGMVLYYQRKYGWSDLVVIDLLCQYIGNQQSYDAIRDFLEEQAAQEDHDE